MHIPQSTDVPLGGKKAEDLKRDTGGTYHNLNQDKMEFKNAWLVEFDCGQNAKNRTSVLVETIFTSRANVLCIR